MNKLLLLPLTLPLAIARGAAAGALRAVADVIEDLATPAPAPFADVPFPRAVPEPEPEPAPPPGPGSLPDPVVDEPWQGYRAMTAPDVIDRLRVADDATRAVVRLYESTHRRRKTVLAATEA